MPVRFGFLSIHHLHVFQLIQSHFLSFLIIEMGFNHQHYYFLIYLFQKSFNYCFYVFFIYYF